MVKFATRLNQLKMNDKNLELAIFFLNDIKDN